MMDWEKQKEFYSGAVIRLASLQKVRGEMGHLLFATVSLLPRGRPLPYSMNGVDKCSIGKGGMVYFRRVVLKAQEAIDWYRSLDSGNDKTPVPFREEERNNELDGKDLGITPLTDDLTWPSIGLPIGEDIFAHLSGSSHPAPFISGDTSARIHRRFGSQEGFDEVLADDEAVAFIARRLHINLRFYQEYLGSISLVAPDPVLKKIDCFMTPSTDDKGEEIFYRFVPRSGASLTGLKLTTFDEQNGLLTDTRTQDIPENGIVEINKGLCAGTYGYVVTHPEHGVLAYNPLCPFLRQITFNTHVISPEKPVVRVPTGESKNSPSMEYEAAQHSTALSHNAVKKEPQTFDVNVRIGKEESRRKKLNAAKQYGQRWFSNGSREEAMRFIQAELRRARKRVIIADPYLAGLQLGQFLYAVNRDVSVTLLSSNSAFKKDHSKINDFSQKLDQLQNKAKVKAGAYVLESSILHDRFLVIDDAVWFLGSSLNSLGSKASLIVKLPNPDEVISQLDGMLNQAISFKDYKTKKQV